MLGTRVLELHLGHRRGVVALEATNLSVHAVHSVRSVRSVFTGGALWSRRTILTIITSAASENEQRHHRQQ